jgi:hypothetical protein
MNYHANRFDDYREFVADNMRMVAMYADQVASWLRRAMTSASRT